MLTDEKLMRKLIRTANLARRAPKEDGEDPSHAPRGKGFWHILDMLTEGDGISQQQIADEMDIRPQSVSEALVKMEDRGLIRRVSSEADKRSMLIYITEKGMEQRKQLAQARILHAEKFFSVLSDNEKRELFAILQKLNQANKGKKHRNPDNCKEEKSCQEE